MTGRSYSISIYATAFSNASMLFCRLNLTKIDEIQPGTDAPVPEAVGTRPPPLRATIVFPEALLCRKPISVKFIRSDWRSAP